MPKFTREVGETSFAPTIQQPVEDNSTAQAIQTFGGITRQLMAGAAVREFRGAAQGPDEVEADPTLVQEGVPFRPVEEQVGELDTLSKIAAARKGGLRGDIAKARAEVAFRKALADNPMFGDEIRQTYGSFFQSQLGKTGFFVDPEVEQTPQEKAMATYLEETSLTALRAGISFDQAAAQGMEINRLKQAFKAIELKQQISAGDLSSYSSAITNHAALSLQQRAVIMAKEGNGRLTPEQVTQLKSEAIIAATRIERQWEGLAANKGLAPNADSRAELRRQTQNMVKTIETFISNISNQEYIANNTEMFSDYIRLRSMKANPEIFALKNIYGESGLATLISMADSRDYHNFKRNNPFVRNMQNILGPDSEFGNRLFYQGLGYLSPETPVDEVDDATLQAAAVHLKNAEVATKIPLEKMNKIVSSEPAAIVMLDSPKWRAEVDKGYAVQNINSFLKNALTTEVGKYSSSRNRILTDLNIPVQTTQEITGVMSLMTEGMRARGTDILKVTDQEGQRIDPKFASRIQEAIGVSKRFPELWEGFFESPEEYVKSLIVPVKEETEEPEEEPKEVTFTEEESAALRVMEAKKQFPDLNEEEIKAALGI